MRHAFLETDREAVVSSRSRWAKAFDALWAGSRNQLSRRIGHASFKSEIGGADSRNVFDVFVIVVQSQHHVVRDLPLQADVVVKCVRNFEPRIYADGNLPGSSVDTSYRREISERIPGPVIRRNRNRGVRTGEIRHRRVSSGQKLVRGKSRQLLDVGHIHDAVRGNGSVTRCNDAVEIIDAIERRPKAVRTTRARSLNLRVRHRVGNANRRPPERLKEAGKSCRIAVEEPRKRQQALALNIRAAESGDVSGNASAELIEENAKAGIDHSFRIGRPSNTQTRRKIRLVGKARVIVPTQAGVHGDLGSQSPVILYEYAVIVVMHFHKIVLGRCSTLQSNQIDARIDWSKGVEIVDGRKELCEKVVGLRSVHVGMFVVPAKLDEVTAKLFAEIG